jgi:lysophospholipase L1-like esterase
MTWQLRRNFVSHAALRAGGVPAMPTGATGIWYADTYVAPTGQNPGIIPDTNNSTAWTGNMVPLARCFFANTNCFQVNSATMVDNNAVGPDGLTEASTLTFAGGSNWFVAPSEFSGASVPNGTYTIAINARWKGTGSASFKIGNFSTSSYNVYTAADQLWHRVSQTVTLTGAQTLFSIVISPDASSAASWEFCDFNIFAGSTDNGPAHGESHIVALARTAQGFGSGYTLASGAVELNTGVAGAFGVSAFNPTNITILMVVKKTGTGTSADFHPILGDPVTNSNLFAGPILNGLAHTFWLENATAIPVPTNQRTMGTTFDKTGDGLMMTSYSFDGTTAKAYSNGSLIVTAPASNAPAIMHGFRVGTSANKGLQPGYALHALALYPRALTDAEVAAAYLAIKTRATNNSITLNENTLVFFAGDSITFGNGDTGGQGLTGYADRAVVSTTKIMTGVNYGISGATIATFTSSGLKAKMLAAIPAQKNGRKFVAHIFFGANDLTTLTPAQFLSALDTLLSDTRAAGFDYIVVGTVLPRSASVTPATWDTARATVNTGIRSRVGTTIDAVADYGSTSNGWGADGGFTGATYSSDGLHPNATGHADMATQLAPVLNALP